MPRSWEFPSNSGNYDATAELVTTKVVDGVPVFVTNVTFRDESPWADEPEDDLQLVLRRIEIPRPQLVAAHVAIASWLNDHRPVEQELSWGRPGARLTLTMGPEPELISTDEKPVCRFSYAAASGAEGTRRWVVDQSCVRIWLDGVSLWLSVGIGV